MPLGLLDMSERVKAAENCLQVCHKPVKVSPVSRGSPNNFPTDKKTIGGCTSPDVVTERTVLMLRLGRVMSLMTFDASLVPEVFRIPDTAAMDALTVHGLVFPIWDLNTDGQLVSFL